jgi:hypothetical protein
MTKVAHSILPLQIVDELGRAAKDASFILAQADESTVSIKCLRRLPPL